MENSEVLAIQGEMEFHVELQYGDFGCADPEVEKRTKERNYNVKIMMWISKDTTTEVCDTLQSILYTIYKISI